MRVSYPWLFAVLDLECLLAQESLSLKITNWSCSVDSVASAAVCGGLIARTCLVFPKIIHMYLNYMKLLLLFKSSNISIQVGKMSWRAILGDKTQYKIIMWVRRAFTLKALLSNESPEVKISLQGKNTPPPPKKKYLSFAGWEDGLKGHSMSCKNIKPLNTIKFRLFSLGSV